jgi:hypothetical protein
VRDPSKYSTAVGIWRSFVAIPRLDTYIVFQSVKHADETKFDEAAHL